MLAPLRVGQDRMLARFDLSRADDGSTAVAAEIRGNSYVTGWGDTPPIDGDGLPDCSTD